MIPDDFKQQLLNRVDIVDVVERHVALRKAGQNFVGLCPFHHEKTPSFSVSPSKQFYHCFGCGVHGNAIGFLMEHVGMSYVEAVKELAASVGMTVPQVHAPAHGEAGKAAPDLSECLLRAARFYKEQLKKSERAVGYLKGRGVSGEIAARFGLGYAPGGWQALADVFSDYRSNAGLKESGLVIDADAGRRYDRFRDRIMFPILSARGTIIGFGGRVIDTGEPKYLNSPETPLFEKGRELYGLFQARQGLREAQRALVVEGYMDVVALAQHGVAGAVATLGTATSGAHIEKLLRLTDEVVFCFDGDQAGRRAAWRAVETCVGKLADGKRIGFLFLPERDDPDSFVRREGREAFEARLREAVPLSEMIVTELGKRADARSAEGKARLLNLAKPLLSQVTAPALGLMLRRRVAASAGIDVGELERVLGLKRSHPGSAKASVRPVRERRTPALTRWFLGAVLTAPHLAPRLDRSLLDPADRYTPALLAVLELLAERPDIGVRQVIPWAMEQIRDAGIASALREVESELLNAPEVDLESEFAAALMRAKQQKLQRRLDVLLARESRSVEEQAELEALLRSLSEWAKEGAKEPADRVEASV